METGQPLPATGYLLTQNTCTIVTINRNKLLHLYIIFYTKKTTHVNANDDEDSAVQIQQHYYCNQIILNVKVFFCFFVTKYTGEM